jgi:orotate phosphoribosyltransferase
MGASTVLAQRIHARAHLTGEFTLRSGQVSTEYFDKYLFESDPELLRAVVTELVTLIPADTEVLAGLELGGVPLATLASQQTGLPAVFVRKAAKKYGTGRIAEGGSVDGRRVTVIEDVVTTGGQIIASTVALRDQGARVDVVVCVIDREAGGSSYLARDGLELRPVFTMTDLVAATSG